MIGKQGLSAVLDVAASLSNLTSLDVSGGFPPPNFSTPVSESGHLARAFGKREKGEERRGRAES